jgi:predicted RNA-binding protein with PIN domain
MSRHYLLDGYNIVKQVPRLADLPLSEGREGLVRWINVARPHGSVQNLVTVVFDGHPAHFGSMASGGVKVVFSDNQSADDFIKGVIDIARDKKKFVVVSNDKGITLYVRAQGASVLSVGEFAADLLPAKRSSGKSQAGKTRETGKNISMVQQQKINKEFAKIWLK